MEINNLEDLLRVELQTLYSVEKQLESAIPQLADNANEGNLKNALMQHLEITKQQAKRLEVISKEMGLNLTLNGIVDQGMANIIKEGQNVISQISDPNVKDTAIMGGTEKVEHYEMAAYESAINLAKKLKYNDVADKLSDTYKEEKKAADSIKMMADGGMMGKVADILS